MKKLLIICLCLPSIVYAQHKVTIDAKDQKKYELPKTESDTYMLYTFSEYIELKKQLVTLAFLERKIPLLEKQIDLYKFRLEAKNSIITEKDSIIATYKARSERLQGKYDSCLDTSIKLSSGSIWPWLITGGSLLVAIVGVSFAGYYGAKYRMD